MWPHPNWLRGPPSLLPSRQIVVHWPEFEIGLWHPSSTEVSYASRRVFCKPYICLQISPNRAGWHSGNDLDLFSGGDQLEFCIREVPCSNFDRFTGYPEVLRGNLHSLESNFGIGLRIGNNCLLPKCYVLINRDYLSSSFDSIYAVSAIEKAPLNNARIKL
jgi:hypothetical protein